MKNEITTSIFTNTNAVLNSLTTSLSLPRDVLPSDSDIVHVVNELPELLSAMREELRDERIVKLCLAAGVGLFDAAINYVWNQTIIELRRGVIDFGLDVLKSLKDTDYSERKINELSDNDLLTLSLEINLIDDEAFYFLNQCRDIRNNCSVAHPSVGNIDKYEVETFINRCIKYVLSETKRKIVGVDIKTLVSVLEAGKIENDQLDFWKNNISSTNQQQKIFIFKMMLGKYCDANSSSVARSNALVLSQTCNGEFSEKVIGELVGIYNDYAGKNETKRKSAAEDFITKLGFVSFLNENTQHSIISKLCKQLMTVHYDWNNFANEIVFAETLETVASQTKHPDSVKAEYVETVVTCGIGNRYGVSNGARPFYEKMIKSFSPKEIEIMLRLPDKNDFLRRMIDDNSNCRKEYKNMLELISDNEKLLSSSLKILYADTVKKYQKEV